MNDDITAVTPADPGLEKLLLDALGDLGFVRAAPRYAYTGPRAGVLHLSHGLIVEVDTGADCARLLVSENGPCPDHRMLIPWSTAMTEQQLVSIVAHHARLIVTAREKG